MNTTQVTAALYQLQQLDLEIDRLAAEKQSVANSLQGSPTLRRLRTEHKTAQQQQVAGEQSQKEAEWTLDEYNQRLAAQERRLYSGSIVNAKELQALQQETQTLRAQQSRQEERLLEVIDIVEALTEATRHKEVALKEADEQWKQEYVVLQARQSQIEGQWQELQTKRQEITADLDATLLKRYDTMRRSMQGRAVSKVEQNSCQWCRVILTPSEMQQVRISVKLQTCSNCGRILYYER
ncbi:hypothetical protein ccbrp13_44300 [Ktedonobacteria bacterium brp13]|nr:hypothetical protein ccbrp13_44300 [Ktedonobacteria bacterium brp13]